MVISAIFVYVILFWVVFVIIRRAKNLQQNSDKKQPGTAPAARQVKRRPQGFTYYRPHKDITSVSRDMGDSNNSSILRDDKRNDWLARQLREEHQAFKATSEMFDLKIEHASHCDAKLIEQFHRKYCDASGIDRADGTTIHKR